MTFSPNQRATASELQRLRQEAWQQEGVLTVRPSDIPDELLRRLLTALAVQLYGLRAD